MPEHLPSTHAAGDPSPRAILDGVTLRFGGQTILDRIDLTLYRGELALLAGENGSGKTSLLNVLSGFVRPQLGTVMFCIENERVSVTRINPERLALLGVGRLWQDIRLFTGLSVLDNVLAATPDLPMYNPFATLLAYPWVRRRENPARNRALSNLKLLGIADKAQVACDRLSIGEMKRVALARLMQMESSLLLLDEPLAGLDTQAATSFIDDLQRLCYEQEKTLLVVEHRPKTLAKAAHRVLMLRDGHLET